MGDAVKVLIIDGVRVREDDARLRGIHPEQIAEKAAAVIAAAEKAEQDRIDAETAAKADFDAKVLEAAEKLVAEREATAAVAQTAPTAADPKAKQPANKAATPPSK